jgi:hypothetical protein
MYKYELPTDVIVEIVKLTIEHQYFFAYDSVCIKITFYLRYSLIQSKKVLKKKFYW